MLSQEKQNMGFKNKNKREPKKTFISRNRILLVSKNSNSIRISQRADIGTKGTYLVCKDMHKRVLKFSTFSKWVKKTYA